VVESTAWNDLSLDPRALLDKDFAYTFYKYLGTVLYNRSWTGRPSEKVILKERYKNSLNV